jgi:hypothetical protein
MTAYGLDTRGGPPVPQLRGVWAAGFVVALGAAVATAHGLYEVARAAGVPMPIAALYPLITDGLALVAYATTARLYGPGRSYGWTIVVLAAGLSGLAQAAYLAGAGVRDVPVWLRAGIGAWPAIAAAIVAHLLHLLVTSTDDRLDTEVSNPSNALYSRANGRLDGVVRLNGTVSNPPSNGTDPLDSVVRLNGTVSNPTSNGIDRADSDDPAGAVTPARDRARTAAEAHRDRHGCLPSVNQLAALADVARGTAAAALKELRSDPGGPR